MIELSSLDPLTAQCKADGLHSWEEVMQHVHALPYGRNRNRNDLSLVLSEGHGTCSSKHALLKSLADLNGVGNVKLMLVLFKMNGSNTPALDALLKVFALPYIPEAHCYLKINDKAFDFTFPDSHIFKLEEDLLEEVEIMPNQVNRYKVTFHQTYIKQWIQTSNVEYSFDEIWKIRERGIQELSK